MLRAIKSLLAVQALLFLAAALLHSGWLVVGYQHHRAAIAETVIGVVLLVGVAAAVKVPSRRRPIALGAQTFALLGTLLGLTLIFVGVGPQTGLDVGIHAILLLALVCGILLTPRRLSKRSAASVFPTKR